MSVEVGERSGVGVVGGGFDPSNLHLKNELTQIRKAARVLKDPGTTSSARSLAKHHHHRKNGHVEANPIAASSSQRLLESNNRVFLYNWRNQRFEGERIRQIGEDDSKSDGYASGTLLKCHDSNFRPSIRRTIKKKSKRSSYSSASSRHHKDKKLQMKILLSRCTKNVVDGLPCLSLGRDDLLNLVHHSDDAPEDYCYSEDLKSDSAVSPLLVRLKNKRWSHGKEDDSVSCSTPALSTSSYNRYDTTGSLNDADDEVDDALDLPGRQGCGIPCYWSKRSTPKSRNGSSCSPSLSDTLRRKGSTMFGGSKTLSLVSNKRRLRSRTSAHSDGRGVLSMRSENSDDELSTHFAELDLEALSRLDGKRWSSSCRSREGLELVALHTEIHEEGSPGNMRSLSNKYRPMFFEELIGQNTVVQSLVSAVLRRRIAPVYLFQGFRGTGKTSAARIFASALNCLATEETKPCGVCRECADFISGKSRYLEEVDGSNKKGVDQLKRLLKNISVVHPLSFPHYKVFVIDQCHLLPSKTWLAFLRLLDKPLPHVVFILTTTDMDNVPLTILSQCQKHLFNKISNGDIVNRLRKISIDESLGVELNALELIALNADGSLGDAETMLDQLSLFGKRITKSLVNELMGVVSDEKLLDLLELAMSSNATETVIRARELMDAGGDPVSLISQLVTLIVDIIAGTYPSVDAKHKDSLFGRRTLTETELDRLKHALGLLSEAEKHLRVSSERSTWFTATLLQLGSVLSPQRSRSISSQRQSSKATEKSASPTSNSTSRENHLTLTLKPNHSLFIDGKESTVSLDDHTSATTTLTSIDSKMLVNIWLRCIEKCHSKTLRQLLHTYGKLVSISESKGGFIAGVAFEDSNIKARAEGFLSSITNSFEVVLRCNVEVRTILLKGSEGPKSMDRNPMNPENKSTCSHITGDDSELEIHQDSLKISRGSFNVSEGHQSQGIESVSGNAKIYIAEDRKSNVPLRRIESIIHEERLETAWLQGMDKGTPGTTGHSKPERNQVLPQDGMDHPNETGPMNSQKDELNHEINVLDGTAHQKDQIVKKIEHCPISPSLLHENRGYESGSGACDCSGMFCWNSRRPHGRAKVNQGKSGGFSLFGACAKSSRDNR